MKRFLCLVLCIVFAFSFTACGKKDDTKSNHTVDIAYYAALGRLDQFDYSLGDDIEETKTALSKTPDDHGDSNYFDYPSGEYTVMSDGAVCCCYKTDDMAAGVTHIVKYGDAYGFTAQTVSTQVRDVLSKMGFDATEREAKKGELFFLPAGADMTVLEYKIKDATVLFVFQEHALSATVISK